MKDIFSPSKSSFAVFILVVNALLLGVTSNNWADFTRKASTQLQDLFVSSASAATIKGTIYPNLPDIPALPPAIDEYQQPVTVIPKDSLKCMAENIYYEARGESYRGKLAVGQVVLNRAKLPSYPKTVCGVIYDGSTKSSSPVCQFSWTCRARSPINRSSDDWFQSLMAATELLGYHSGVDSVNGATSFHNVAVKMKAKNIRYVKKIGDHVFYKKVSE